MTPIYLTEEHREVLMIHIRKRLYEAKISLLFFSIFIIPLLYVCFEGIRLTLQGVRIAERIGSAGMISSILLAVLQLGTYAVMGLLILYGCGGKEFIKGSDMDCLKHDAYELEVLPFTRKSEGIDYPYYFYDAMEQKYLCPSYEDWKQVTPETEILFITMKNGHKYAMILDREKVKEVKPK